MRKLSELYQEVLDQYYDIYEIGLCVKISNLVDAEVFSGKEYDSIIDHLKKGVHKLPASKRWGFWFSSDSERIEYLKYLIKLCKEQDI